jgi:hypothetical protein
MPHVSKKVREVLNELCNKCYRFVTDLSSPTRIAVMSSPLHRISHVFFFFFTFLDNVLTVLGELPDLSSLRRTLKVETWGQCHPTGGIRSVGFAPQPNCTLGKRCPLRCVDANEPLFCFAQARQVDGTARTSPHLENRQQGPQQPRNARDFGVASVFVPPAPRRSISRHLQQVRLRIAFYRGPTGSSNH